MMVVACVAGIQCPLSQVRSQMLLYNRLEAAMVNSASSCNRGNGGVSSLMTTETIAAGEHQKLTAPIARLLSVSWAPSFVRPNQLIVLGVVVAPAKMLDQSGTFPFKYL